MTIPVIRFDHLEYQAIEKVLKALRQLRLVDYERRGIGGVWNVVRVSDRFPCYANPSKTMINEAQSTYNEELDPRPFYARCAPDPCVSNNIGCYVVAKLIKEHENPNLLDVLFDLVVDYGPFALEFESPLFTYYQDPPDDFDAHLVVFILTNRQIRTDDHIHSILRVSAFENDVLVGIADTASRREDLEDDV